MNRRMENPHLQRALLLFQQSRHEMAEQELRQALAQDPNLPLAHSLLGLCLSRRNVYDQATSAAQQAVHLAPDMPFSYYALASILYDRNRYPEAEEAIGEAIALDPYEADQFGLLSAIKFEQRKWPAALQAAEQGLAIDPESVRCANLRALALNKLGRSDGAADMLETALAKDPENADAHANLGWTRLQQGRSQESLAHFREALRLNPESQWARAGIVEALKSRNLVYRWLLAYFMWISRLSEGAQWGVIIGAYVGYLVLREVANKSPDLAIWIQPALWLYIAFAVLTWIGTPVFNLLLRLNRYGRLALSRDQIVASNWVGLTLLAALILLAAGLLRGEPQILLSALMFGLLALPLSATFHLHSGWPRQMMGLYTLGLLLCAVVSSVARLFPALLGERAEPLSAIGLLLFVVGVFVSQFVANALAHRTPRY
jgi:tetratricopeptide (TPR) repeat protein